MTTATQHDANDMASVQVSIAEFLDAYEDPDEPADESNADNSETVFASKGGHRYHKTRCGIPACPNIDAEEITLAIAEQRGLRPCGRCHPTEYRDDEQQSNNATLEGF